MDLSYGPEYERFRADVQAFLREEWRPEGQGEAALESYVAEFRQKAIGRGYLYRNVPTRYGGSEQPPDVLKAEIVRDEFAAARAPREVSGNGVEIVVPTLLECGEEWQRESFIRRTIGGELQWAQGYSEPGAGSDLASVRTRAELAGNEWVINGQKVWTSLADRCQYMFALVRTEFDRPKHEGISFLLFDLRQPGVTIRPLRQMTGEYEFSEVFLENVRTPQDWIIGRRGDGWQISRSSLKHERASIGSANRGLELLDKLVKLARKTQRFGAVAIQDREIRQNLAALEGWILARKYSAYRQLSLAAAGREPGLLGLLDKLAVTEIGHETARIAQELIGAAALLQPAKPGTRRGNERWLDQIIGSLAVAIAGGTSNIQRNIVAERGLGLPRGPLPAEGAR